MPGGTVIKLRKPWLIRPAGTLAATVIRLLMGTVRIRLAVAGPERQPPTDNERFVFVFWHEAIVLMTGFRIPLHVLSSLHADGELMTRICRHLKIGVIRGSTTRGGSQALLGLVRRTGGTHVALTPDGPVGPRRRLKPGAVALASTTGMRIVPVGISCPTAFRARSWDRMMVPLPWTTAHYVTGPAITVPAGLDRTGLTRYCRLVEDSLGTVTDAAERWAAGGPRPVAAMQLARAA
jgi:lysophospholipid acyltransferase (LPLAT)-like uncharacterized protein